MKRILSTISTISLSMTLLTGHSALAAETLCAKEIEGPSIGPATHLKAGIGICPKGGMMTLSSPVIDVKVPLAVNMEVNYGAIFEISPLADTYLTVKNVVCTEANPCIIDTYNWSPRWGELSDIRIMNLNHGKEIGYKIKNISDGRKINNGVLLGSFEIITT